MILCIFHFSSEVKSVDDVDDQNLGKVKSKSRNSIFLFPRKFLGFSFIDQKSIKSIYFDLIPLTFQMRFDDFGDWTLIRIYRTRVRELYSEQLNSMRKFSREISCSSVEMIFSKCANWCCSVDFCLILYTNWYGENDNVK